jgi:hypothetical protein
MPEIPFPPSGVPLKGVGREHLREGAVGTDVLADGSVTAAKIATDAVGSAAIAPNAVGSSELADNSVDQAAMLDNSVGTAELIDGNVTDTKLAAPIDKGFKGRVDSTSDSSAVTTETVVLTLSSFVFKDTRAYRVRYGKGILVTGTSGDGVFRFRKTNAAGTLYGDGVRHNCATISTTNAAEGEWYVKRSAGSDLTTDVVLTLQVSGATNVLQRGTSTLPRYLQIEDCGQASDFPNILAVT